MKCQNCSREIKLWQSACPYCQSRTQPNSYSTITEAPEVLEQKSRRRLLQQVLQFSLVAVTFIALASLIRFNPPKANTLPPESLRASASNSPTPTPTPELVAPAERPSETPIVAPIEVAPAPAIEPQTISLFSAEDLRMAKTRPAPAAFARPTVTRTSTPTKSSPAAVTTDEAAPKKIATPIASSVAVPASSSTTITAETNAQLEVESAGVLLHPNTGLVTIKSYVPARVYIDGVYSGSTPRSVKLLAGDHTISLLANGYHDYSRKVKVSGQQQLGILASMSKK
jgi:PEGA domain